MSMSEMGGDVYGFNPLGTVANLSMPLYIPKLGFIEFRS
jgi:hypothetical protein